jgi:hypothetical protein
MSLLIEIDNQEIMIVSISYLNTPSAAQYDDLASGGVKAQNMYFVK